MAVDQSAPRSPGWWLARLGKKLDAHRDEFDRLHCYYTGRHPLPTGDAKMRPAFQRFQRKARTNYTGLVVDSVRERLKVVGFRAGGEGTPTTDDETWRTWQANKLDAVSNQLHDSALIASLAFVIVGPQSEARAGRALITAEDARQVAYEPDPLDWRKAAAALKTYPDEVRGLRIAVLYLPDAVWYFRAKARSTGWLASSWEPDVTDEYPDGYAANTVGEVPVFPFVNRPDLYGNGLGEFEDVTDIQDRINTTILDRMVIGSMQAYRQRWATGIKLTDEDGNPDAPFVPGVDHLWGVEDENAKFGDFAETNLAGILSAVRDDITDLAAITRTPPHYLLGSIVNASGDALTAAETGLVSKVKDRQVEYGEQWEDVMRLAGKYEGREVPADAEVIWLDPEQRSLAELADAAVKKGSAGVPWRQRMEDMRYTPQQIDRMEAERTADAALVAAFGPPVVTNAPGPIGAEVRADSTNPNTNPEATPGTAPTPPSRGG